MNPTKKDVDFENPENKSSVTEPKKSSMQILSELFSSFDVEPPIIVKKEKKDKTEESSKKSKKSKKKHKHKDKKHKKKSKKKRKSTSSSSSSSSSDGEQEVDLAQLLIKQEKNDADKKIKIEGTSLSLDIPELLPDIKYQIKKEERKIKHERKEEITNVHDSKRSSASERKKIKHEEGEITDSDIDSKKRKKHKHRDKEKSKRRRSDSRERSESREKKLKHEDLRHKIKREHVSPDKNSHKTRHHSTEKSLSKSGHRSRDRDRSKSKDRSHRSKYWDDYDREQRTRYRDREISSYKDDGFRSRNRSKEKEISRERDRSTRDEKWFMRDRYRGYDVRDRSSDRHRERSRDREETSSRIDKKKLLEIARRNAVQMMKSGSLPGALSLSSKAQEKMIAAIKSGGKTIEELTDFCKSLSKKEELGELSSMSEKEESDPDEPFHHPFQIKDRPTTITMNIKNSVPLPTKTTHERTTELRIQFPVSSGQQHRVTEEWVPVAPAQPARTTSTNIEKPKVDTSTAEVPLVPELPSTIDIPLPQVPLPPEPISSFVPAPPNAPPGPQVYPSPASTEPLPAVDICSVVSQRLTAMRKLQENPHDVQALSEMYKSNKNMQTWAKSKQQPGQFTGTTGVQVLSQAELASGYQAWAKKDQLQTAAPVSGGMGMHLLQKMGWKPGEGLGKEKSGTLEPLLLEVKLDKKGLVANEEQRKGKKKVKALATTKTLQGKHPVSLLGEYATKRKLGAPQYILELECGPDHKKNFLFKVIINGMEYKPNIASANKKEAKANAATLALKQIGLLV